MIEVELPDGNVAEFPDNTDPAVIKTALAKRYPAPAVQEPGLMDKALSLGKEGLQSVSDDIGDALHANKNLAMGGLRGAASIGNTLMWPVDAAIDYYKGDRKSDLSSLVTGQKPLSRHEERVQGVNSFFEDHAEPGSIPFKIGKVGSEIAGTAGTGSVLANGAKALGATPEIVAALQSGGFNLGGKTSPGLVNALKALALRTGAGATVGGVQTALVDPEHAGTGAIIGGAMPVGVQVAGNIGQKASAVMDATAKKLMNSALKPTIKMHQTGDAEQAIQTLLSRGINPTSKGVDQLQSLIDDIDSQVKGRIAGSNATIDKQAVLDYLNQAKAKFGSQVNPAGDLAAIDKAGQEFAAHPKLTGDAIPIQLAQDLKTGTYKVLNGKYGQLGSADIEAQKALARGLKDQIAQVAPEVVPLNAEQQALITAKKVATRRAMMDANNNPLGLTSLAPSKEKMLAFLLDRNVLAKSLMARGAHSAAESGKSLAKALTDMSPEGRTALLSILTNQ